MKLVNYRCDFCQVDYEEIFKSDEEIPETLDKVCPSCNAMETLHKWNFKNNDQVQKFKGEW